MGDLVDPAALARANGLAQLGPAAGIVIGPALASPLVARWGIEDVLGLDLATAWRASFPDGAWRVDLAGLPPGCDAGTLRASVAHVLRLSEAAAQDDEAMARRAPLGS